MAKKNSAPKIKFTGIRDGENSNYITRDSVRQTDPAVRFVETYGEHHFSLDGVDWRVRAPIGHFDGPNALGHVYPRSTATKAFEKYLSRKPVYPTVVMCPESDYRGDPVKREHFMRKLSLMLKLAALNVDLNRTTMTGARQVGKSVWEYRFFHQQLHTVIQLHHELMQLEKEKPLPIDLTRYIKLITGKDVWEKPSAGTWGSEFTKLYFSRHQAGVGKSMLYNMHPSVKLHLKKVNVTFFNKPYVLDDEFLRGRPWHWPDTIEIGMGHNGPALTAQLNREKLIKPKKGKV